MMKLEINITKGKFWVLVSLLVVVIGVFVLADKPTPVGHSKDEIEGLEDLVIKVTALEEKDDWPEGSYCIWKKGTCPTPFIDASLNIDGEDNDEDWNTGGPIGDSASTGGSNVLLVACCK